MNSNEDLSRRITYSACCDCTTVPSVEIYFLSNLLIHYLDLHILTL